MIKNNLRIKDYISLDDKVNVIDRMVDASFTGDTYTPYLVEPTGMAAVAYYFLDGVQFDDDENVYDAIINDDELQEYVFRFINDDGSNTPTDEVMIMREVRDNVYDMIQYKKQVNAQYRPDLDVIVECAEKVIRAFNNLANLHIPDLSEDDIKVGMEALNKIAHSENVNVDLLGDVIHNAYNKIHNEDDSDEDDSDTES